VPLLGGRWVPFSAQSNILTKYTHWIIQVHALVHTYTGSVLRAKPGCSQTWRTDRRYRNPGDRHSKEAPDSCQK
jgi:hypothetical protein